MSSPNRMALNLGRDLPGPSRGRFASVSPGAPQSRPSYTPAVDEQAKAERGIVDLDLGRYLADGPSELRRTAEGAWCAHAVDMSGAPMPIVLFHEDVRDVMRD